MWNITIHSPDTRPKEYTLKAGTNTIGRRNDNDLVIPDQAASRAHAEFSVDEKEGTLTLRDLGSRNGTFLNRQRLPEKKDFPLAPRDVVRIGLFEMIVSAPEEEKRETRPGFTEFSRELLLESFDNHAVILYEVIHQLNNVMDADVALHEISNLLQRTLGAKKCQVILAKDFSLLQELGFPRTIAQAAIEKQITVMLPSNDLQSKDLLSDTAKMLKVKSALCVPVVSDGKTIAIIYMIKTRSDTRNFGPRDMQLAVAVGHLAALTIERVSLMTRVREETRIRQLLQRFVAPLEAEHLLHDFLNTGNLPGLTEKRATVLFADIEGSNRLSERLGAKRFGELLENYYQEVTDVVFRYGGMLINYLGDGVVAVFGLDVFSGDEPPAGSETKAVSAAVDVIAQVKSRFKEEDLMIDVGVGINTGSVMAGYIRTRERVELSVLGDAVNIAAGLQSLARPNRILVGGETYAAVKDSFTIQSLGEKKIKDRTQPLNVYEVVTKAD